MKETLEIYTGYGFDSFPITEEELQANDQIIRTHWEDISSRHAPTADHLINVSILCEGSAKAMGFSPLMTEVTRQAALLHDAGKIWIPFEILDKPGPLDAEEREIIKRHVEYTDDLLGIWNISLLVRLLANQHHERRDGSGYPYGWKGEKIHEIAQMLAVADSLDAATRPWGNLPDLIEELASGESNLYHPQIAGNVLQLFTDNLVGEDSNFDRKFRIAS